MTDITTEIHNYRDTTARHAVMAGVMAPNFRCARCKQVKLTAGRRQAVKGSNKHGWLCRDCSEK